MARLVFREDGKGAIAGALYSPVPITALIKNRWFEGVRWNLTLLGVCVVAYLSYLVRAGTVLVRRRRQNTGEHETRWARVAHWSAVAASSLGLGLLLCILLSLSNGVGLFLGHLPLWRFVQPASLLFALLALLATVSVAGTWTQRCGN